MTCNDRVEHVLLALVNARSGCLCELSIFTVNILFDLMESYQMLDAYVTLGRYTALYNLTACGELIPI